MYFASKLVSVYLHEGHGSNNDRPLDGESVGRYFFLISSSYDQLGTMYMKYMIVDVIGLFLGDGGCLYN